MTLYHAASDNTIPLMYSASDNKELYTIHIIHHIQEKFFSQLNWNWQPNQNNQEKKTRKK